MYIQTAMNFRKKVQQLYEADRDSREGDKQSKVRHPNGYCYTFHDENYAGGETSSMNATVVEGHTLSPSATKRGKATRGVATVRTPI